MCDARFQHCLQYRGHSRHTANRTHGYVYDLHIYLLHTGLLSGRTAVCGALPTLNTFSVCVSVLVVSSSRLLAIFERCISIFFSPVFLLVPYTFLLESHPFVWCSCQKYSRVHGHPGPLADGIRSTSSPLDKSCAAAVPPPTYVNCKRLRTFRTLLLAGHGARAPQKRAPLRRSGLTSGQSVPVRDVGTFHLTPRYSTNPRSFM